MKLTLRRGVAAAAALMLCPVALVAAADRAGAAPACRVDYTITNQWNVGFGASVVVTNLGDAISAGWTLEFDFAAGQVVTQGWSGDFTQSAAHVSVRNPSWAPDLATGATANPGFNGSWSGSNPVPTAFRLNGTPCTGTPPPTTPPPTTTPPPSTPPPSTTPPPPGSHVDNPYAGAKLYVNPDWSAQVTSSANTVGGTLGTKMRAVAGNSTAVWLDRIAAVAGGSGVTRTLAGHLDAALAQATGSAPVAITIVVYDLPNRDCAALASNGELLVAQNGLARYKTEYIDRIATVLADSRYRNLRIVAVVEPDSLPNLVTNLSTAPCAEANSSGAYVQGIQYAVNKLHAFPNVYQYLDIAHSGWLGWDSNFGPAVQLITNTVRGTTAGLNSIDGFISNTANYTPIQEPFVPDPNSTINGQQVKSATFYEFNPYFDELHYSQAMRTAFIGAGFPSGIGMLVDTSRNGWGGTARPTGASTSTDLNTNVNASRLDRRPHRGGWCNQSGAGIGARPTTASPASGLDAYVWIKPPGESDGVSSNVPDPNDPSKKFDGMCDPAGRNRYNNAFPTNALPNAPHAGRWFEAEFEMLVQNAFPAL
jgi:cellulose 1,4-beta-cellobiosidase